MVLGGVIAGSVFIVAPHTDAFGQSTNKVSATSTLAQTSTTMDKSLGAQRIRRD